MDDDPYGDPRLVALYDQDNPDGPDHDFFRALADELDARTIVDLGCGTGILTVTLARAGRTVIGVDPSAPMLDYARNRPGGDAVQWVVGDSTSIGTVSADLVIMTGNVAQHIGSADWPLTLHDVHNGLRRGGTLAFESRNPTARPWESWSDDRSTRPAAHGALTEWMELVRVSDDEVTFDAHNVFEATGEHVVSTLTLTFRSPERLVADLADAGLTIRSMVGGWAGQPLETSSPLIVVRAGRSAD